MAPAIDRSRPRTVFSANDTGGGAFRTQHRGPRHKRNSPIYLGGSLYQVFRISLLL